MDSSIISIQGLWHKYQKQWAIQDISLSVSDIGIYGLLGSNGAGKSTLMNILCGVIAPTKGTVIIKGLDIRKSPIEAKKYIGFLPQQPPLLKELTVREYLVHASHLRFIDRDKVKSSVNAALEKCALTHFQHRMIRNLSGGYQQRVGIAQAIIHEPALVVLDEPTNGLDPIQILEIRKLIREIAEERTVILSTHILQEVQALCDTIWLLNGGEVRFSGSLDAFNGTLQESVLEAACLRAMDETLVLEIEGIHRVEKTGDFSYKIYTDGNSRTIEAFVECCVFRKWGIIKIAPEKRSLESIFSEYSQTGS